MTSTDRSKGNLSVNVGEGLLERINTVAKALKQSQAEFVRNVLDEKKKAYRKLADEIAQREAKIAERERRHGTV
jgi:hemoglobin-like flavoprotein